MHLNLLVVLITKLTTYSDQWSYNVIPLLYGGVEMHTKHDWDTKEDLYYTQEKKLTILPNSDKPKPGLGQVGTNWDSTEQVRTTPKIM